MAYAPIENYGVIGDLHTVALVGLDGSIDWFCYPHFDSPSVFAAILDDAKGGRFRIAPAPDHVTRKQLYLPDTNVLVTRFLTVAGMAEVTDFMPVRVPGADDDRRQIIRIVEGVRGELPFHLECRPAFDYARAPHDVVLEPKGAVFRSDGLTLALASPVPLRRDGAGVRAEFTLRAGERRIFLLAEVDRDAERFERLTGEHADRLFRLTTRYWRAWTAGSRYRGRWREMVNRSALALKLLTFAPTGAIVAAPTCSLPERIGGARNWDYRYTWIRDASFTVYGLMRVGFTEEARRFMDWLAARIHALRPDGTLQIMYTIEGREDLTERTLDHLEGYRGSKPVRIGNGAARQVQLDIYGELMDAVYLFNKHGTPIGYDLWLYLRRMLDTVVEHWRDPDDGIWEVRGGPRHFVYSKFMCWVALDRGLRLADKRSFPADRARWRAARDAIYEEIMERGWSEKLHAFVQSYGSEVLDASQLLMPLTFFLSPTDPRMIGTLRAIQETLASGSLVHRYDPAETPDGVGGAEGTFSMCSFWLVEALTRAGRIEEAQLVFEKMLGYANHLGLYAEEIGPSGEALGNFPQAFTHLGLISAATNLDRALDGGGA
ncbi:MAG: glycoside hydrolase family 15 protein [Hyphomicrobiales bacterium]